MSFLPSSNIMEEISPNPDDLCANTPTIFNQYEIAEKTMI